MIYPRGTHLVDAKNDSSYSFRYENKQHLLEYQTEQLVNQYQTTSLFISKRSKTVIYSLHLSFFVLFYRKKYKENQ